MNAVTESFSHTYLFPEKSFSPSMPFTGSMLLFTSFVLINEGANVFEDAGSSFEFARCRGCRSPFGRYAVPPNEECDWVRECEEWLFVADNGEETTSDFGPLEAGAGLGDAELILANRLLRLCGEICAILNVERVCEPWSKGP
jgi:hypothetical protein